MKYLIVTNRLYHPEWNEVHPDMLASFLRGGKPKRVYFPFWSTKVPKEILNNYECIGFHTGGLSGGSPIQHLIREGAKESYIKAFHMTEKIDEGEIIATKTIQLYGSLEEILIRMSKIIMEMIDEAENNKQPTPTKH